MPGLSQRAYARHRGCAESAVRKALRDGRITKEPDGSIDPAKADAQWEANTGLPRGDVPIPKAIEESPPQPEPAEPTQERAPNEVAPEFGREEEGNRSDSGAIGVRKGEVLSLQRAKAQVAKLNAESHLLTLKLLERRGLLIARDQASDFCFGWFRQERDAWMAWPARVAGMLAAELTAELPDDVEVDPRVLNILLEKHVREFITERGQVEPPAFEAAQ